MALGATSVEEIGRRCGAGTNCGGCIPLIEDILESRLVALMNERTIAEVSIESVVEFSSISARAARGARQVKADTHAGSDPPDAGEQVDALVTATDALVTDTDAPHLLFAS